MINFNKLQVRCYGQSGMSQNTALHCSAHPKVFEMLLVLRELFVKNWL